MTADLVSLSLRRCPVEGVRWRLVPWGLRLARALPPDTVRTVRTRDGFRMRVRVGDWLGRHVYVRGEYEPATARVFKALLQPGNTFIDVGANAGYFSLLASKCVGPSGRVWAFEPVPVTREELLANLKLNDAGNVKVFAQALSNAAGTASLSVGPVDHRGTSSLRALDDGSATLIVETARLDDLLSPGQKVDCVKIDVEGAEHLALQGMVGCLKRDRPDLVLEVTDEFLRPLGSSAEGLCRALADLGYRMYMIDHTGLVPFEPGEAAAWPQYNALFTTRESLPVALLLRAAEV
jgi:FkbM family methyltransferase